MTTQKNYQHEVVANVYQPGRSTLHARLALTGSEISINTLSPGVALPFVHAHKQNEDVYVVLKGAGKFFVDGEEFAVQEGSAVRIDPSGARSIKADASSALTYICVQSKRGSLTQHTKDDGMPADGKPSWV